MTSPVSRWVALCSIYPESRLPSPLTSFYQRDVPAPLTCFIHTGSETLPSKTPTLTPGPGFLQGFPARWDLQFIDPTFLPLLHISSFLVCFPPSLQPTALHYHPFLTDTLHCVLWAWQNTNPPTPLAPACTSSCRGRGDISGG